jgi:hypothetical protein
MAKHAVVQALVAKVPAVPVVRRVALVTRALIVILVGVAAGAVAVTSMVEGDHVPIACPVAVGTLAVIVISGDIVRVTGDAVAVTCMLERDHLPRFHIVTDGALTGIVPFL